MPEIIKTYRQSMPAVRFVGIRYHDSDRTDGGFGRQWDEWHDSDRFSILDKQIPDNWFEDADSTIGLMRWKDAEPFEYWIGLFLPPDAAVPDGFESVDFPASDLGTVWLRGTDADLYGHEDKCAGSCMENGYEIIPDGDKAFWFFERYSPERFVAQNENDEMVLDICHFIK